MTRRERETAVERERSVTKALTDRDVAEYLRTHPDFLDKHPKVLRDLELHHRPGRAAVSLVQRQVAMLRKQNEELHTQLKDLVAVARDNHELVEKIHQLAISMLPEVDPEQRIQALRTRLHADFKVETAVLIMFTAPFAVPAHDQFLKVVERRDPRLKSFASFLKANQPLCVRLRPAQRRFAFGESGAELKSAALVPLGRHAELGFIVIGSRDPDYFHPGKRTDYLRRLGEVVSIALISGRGASAAKSGPKASGS